MGEGTILLVDGDAEVRSVTAQLLELDGFSVLTVRNAVEAVTCFREDEGEIDILVTDLLLPDDINGIELTATPREAVGIADCPHDRLQRSPCKRNFG